MLLRLRSASTVRRSVSLASANAKRASSALALPPEIRARIRDRPLEQSYDPAAVEAGWHEYWHGAIAERQRREAADACARDKRFSMLLPPPNVTGALHIGHALTITIQDALARWHHMRGFQVRWIPGLDHAGIATQSVVERKLAKDEGVSKHDLGRDAFLQHVWEWNDQYGGRILHQIDQLGAVVNKDQAFFTLDKTRSDAVIEAFVRLHERGLVLRKRRMVNWCPTLRTAISDIEVDAESLTGRTMMTLPGRSKAVEFGVMHRILYKVAESGDYLQVDTTRPETIFGDVAVAVHSQDPRYVAFHDKHVVHPFNGRLLPVVVDDELVNMELGTGVVKVTPAHDPRDYECGLRHGLPEPVVIDERGKLCGDVDPRFVGLDRFEAREKVVTELQKSGLYVEKLDHPTTLSICSRSGDVIEPLLKPQWFVDCRAMAKRAADHVRDGTLAVEPSSHEHMWYFFLDNIQDWCVSRQLWWGHRIPAYRVRMAGLDDAWIVARSIDEARAKALDKYGPAARDAALEQDEDVLDTWFSSGLLPLSVSGWPHGEALNNDVYPLSVMETGSDILFFWVARMAMLCEEFSGHVPFERILLHPMVRDKAGRKMSKSLGNVIDPIHVITGISLDELLSGVKAGNATKQEMARAEKQLRREFPQGIPACGTDALRSALASYLQQGRQINMDLQRVVSHRQFFNKIWNAVRYALPLLETNDAHGAGPSDALAAMGVADRWILSRLAKTVVDMTKSMQTNQLATSIAAFQRFFVQDLCDVYIEFSKRVLYGNRVNLVEFGSEQAFAERQRAARVTLFTCLDLSMRLLHPFAPFVTEELWQRIRTYDPAVGSDKPVEDTSLLFTPYPEHDHFSQWVDAATERDMQLIIDVLHAIRSLRHTVKTVAPMGGSVSSTPEEPMVRIVSTTPEDVHLLQVAQPNLESQARISIAINQVADDKRTEAILRHSVSPTCTVEFPVPDDPDTPTRVRSEISRLQNRVEKMEATLAGLRQRQESAGYRGKVPDSIQQQESARAGQLSIDIHATRSSIDALKQLEQHY